MIVLYLLVERVKSRLDPRAFSDGMNRKLADFIFDRASSRREVHVQSVLASLTDEEAQKFVAGLTMEDMPDDSSDLILDRLVVTIRRDEIHRQIEEIHRQIQEGAPGVGSDEAVERLLARKSELQRLLQRMK